MFRTRDFILFFVTIVFLLMAIGATLLSNFKSDKTNDASLPKLSPVSDLAYEAVIVSNESISRSEKLAAMKQKIAESSDLIIKNYDGEEVLTEEELNDAEEEQEEPLAGLTLCNSYSNYTGHWPATLIKTDTKEGLRIFYIESETLSTSPETASSTVPVSMVITRDTKLQLSLSPYINGQSNCISQDVIAIANQNSLIRNNEVSLYSLFGEETLLGYALDGWPIYGSTERPLDDCGGTMVSGGYRYYIDKDRENIINCFVSVPANI